MQEPNFQCTDGICIIYFEDTYRGRNNSPHFNEFPDLDVQELGKVDQIGFVCNRLQRVPANFVGLHAVCGPLVEAIGKKELLNLTWCPFFNVA